MKADTIGQARNARQRIAAVETARLALMTSLTTATALAQLLEDPQTVNRLMAIKRDVLRRRRDSPNGTVWDGSDADLSRPLLAS